MLWGFAQTKQPLNTLYSLYFISSWWYPRFFPFACGISCNDKQGGVDRGRVTASFPVRSHHRQLLPILSRVFRGNCVDSRFRASQLAPAGQVSSSAHAAARAKDNVRHLPHNRRQDERTADEQAIICTDSKQQKNKNYFFKKKYLLPFAA